LAAGSGLSDRCPIHREEQRRREGSVPTAALPVHGGEKPVTDQQRWIERNTAKARRALADPSVRAALLALLGGDDRSRRGSAESQQCGSSWQGWRFAGRSWRRTNGNPDVIFAIVVGVLAALGSGSRLARRAQV
jgi:hypothetical protein